MKKLTLLISVLLITQLAIGQITFQKTIEGTNFDGDEGHFVQQTSDGGYIITGISTGFSAGYNDVYLIKTDANGDTLWTKTYGGIYGEVGNSVQQTADGGYIITGGNNSFSPPSANGWLYLIKTDPNGNLSWSKTIGGTNYLYGGSSVKQTTDGGYIIAGATQISLTSNTPDVYLIKTDSIGDLLWAKTFGGTGEDEGFSVQQTTDGGYIIGGTTTSFGAGRDLYLIKTDVNGNLLWSKTSGNTGVFLWASSQQTTDGGYIIMGSTNVGIYLLKTDANGDSLWAKVINALPYCEGRYMQQTTDGGYIITGIYTDMSNDGDVLLLKTDTNGNCLWTKTFAATSEDYGCSVQQTTDGGYILTCFTTVGMSKIYLIKTDSTGNSGCNQSSVFAQVTTVATQVTSPATIVTSPATTVNTAATIVGSGGIVTTLCTSVGINELTTDNSFLLSPNPSTGNFIISFKKTITKGTIEISNILGENVYTENIFNESKKEINLKNISNGIYFVKVYVYPDSIGNGEKYYCRKIIIEQD